MTREEVMAATPDELRAMVAEARGWTDIERTEDKRTAFGIWGRAPEPSDCGCYGMTPLPAWPYDISEAWELVEDLARGWRLTFHLGHTDAVKPEYRERKLLIAEGDAYCKTIWVDVVEPFEAAVCRLWLLAKEAERGT